MQPYGAPHQPGGLGWLGVPRCFRAAVVSDLSFRLEKELGPLWGELDIRSCHSEILVGLEAAKTPRLNAIFDKGDNLWAAMIDEIPSSVKDSLFKDPNDRRPQGLRQKSCIQDHPGRKY
jgi:hypothetical protein